MYKKPEIKSFETLFEGVYAYSGDEEILEEFVGGGTEHIPSAEGPAGKPYDLHLTNAWEGNKQYDIIFYNNGSEPTSSFTVTLAVHGDVTSIGGNVSGVINGDVAEISFENYGNEVAPGGDTGAIYMAITGTGDFSLE